MQSAPEASPLCTRKSILCCVTGGGGEVAAVRPGMPWHRGPLPLRRSPRISAAGAMPLGRLKVAVQLSAEGGKVAVCAKPHGRGAGGSRAPRSREKASGSCRYHPPPKSGAHLFVGQHSFVHCGSDTIPFPIRLSLAAHAARLLAPLACVLKRSCSNFYETFDENSQPSNRRFRGGVSYFLRLESLARSAHTVLRFALGGL